MRLPSRYRLSSSYLLQTIENWDSLMNFKVRLIACGGTALTLLNIKESTKDVDFVVPAQTEYKKLLVFLEAIGYREKGGGLAHPDDPYSCINFGLGNGSSLPISWTHH